MNEKQEIEKSKRALAEFEIRSAELTRQRLQEQHDAGSRWLIASLFAINGGAIVAILSSEKFDHIELILPLTGYLIGLIASFVMAVALQISDRKMVAAMHGWGQVWTLFLVKCELDQEQELKAKEKITDAEKIGRFGRMTGLISMSLFSVASTYMIGYFSGIAEVLDRL